MDIICNPHNTNKANHSWVALALPAYIKREKLAVSDFLPPLPCFQSCLFNAPVKLSVFSATLLTIIKLQLLDVTLTFRQANANTVPAALYSTYHC